MFCAIFWSYQPRALYTDTVHILLFESYQLNIIYFIDTFNSFIQLFAHVSKLFRNNFITLIFLNLSLIHIFF